MRDWPDLLDRAYAVVRYPIARLDGALLDRPTPCTEWTVRELVEHTLGAIGMFASAAGAPPPAAGSAVQATLVERFDTAVERNLAAWRALPDPAATLTLPFGEFPAGLAVGMNHLDSLVHGWDIGSALGLSVAWPDDVSDAAMRTAQVRCPLGRGGAFGAEVGTTSTSSQDRLLAFTGRDPAAWPGAV